jgi:hypothetical protein
MPNIPSPVGYPLELLEEPIALCLDLMSLAQWYVYQGSFVLHDGLQARVRVLCNSNAVDIGTFARDEMVPFTTHFRALQLPRDRRGYIMVRVNTLFAELYRFCERHSPHSWQDISHRFIGIYSRIQETVPRELENPQV